MRFIYEGREYAGETAVEIVRGMERDDHMCQEERFSVRKFVSHSLARLSDRIHQRELDTCDHLPDETLALSYLCLLDEYSIGRLEMPAKDSGAPVRD
ncbi:MAG TPA: hypothetical protein VJS44_19575 [Pyrinomonadaceae bacterium]|nr:hypothetical protein [Pyrinomonadaceae bacterium]